MHVLITGATGFVGRILSAHLLAEGLKVRGTVLPEEDPATLIHGVEPVDVEPLGAQTPWGHALAGIDTVIHLAARVHVMADAAADPLRDFRAVNTEGTRQLATAAVRAGVRRLVFASSIKVNGEETDVPYTASSPARPADPYGISKWEAEQALRQIETETGLEVVIVRPPLVYGPGVKANFLSLLRAVQRGLPLPFASIDNRRSLIYVGNLADALATCARHAAAAGNTYLVSDGEDISIPDLIRRLAKALDRPARLVPLPPGLLRLAGGVLGKQAVVERLVGSLTVDVSGIRQDLGWRPPYTMEQGLKKTAEWYVSR